MRIAIASDHAGYNHKSAIIRYLSEMNYDVVDFGTYSDDPVDYPDFVHPAAGAVARGECQRGIVLGGSGNGEAMAANRHKGIRCAVCWDIETARLARAHNNANMLSLGQRLVTEEDALSIVKIWLETEFEGGRHIRRIEKIDE